MKNYFVFLIFLLFTFSGFSQQVGYNVFGVHTNPRSEWNSLVTLDTLQDAKTLRDISARYRPSWVATYHSVGISSTCNGIVAKAVGTSDILTYEQLGILKNTTADCNVDVEIDYIPQNNLKDNPPRKMEFSLRMFPIFEASYPGGAQNLKAYLKESIIDQIPETTLEQVELVKVTFSINEEGQASGVQICNTSEHQDIDQLILTAISNMPEWTPAENAAGEKITQEFEFMMGTEMLRCDFKYLQLR